ncbi:hypothetical protein HanHA300_Chr12g0453451 [Helianthus annuus]|nr:hypothetical protein HanHA300_Chr12g0453451 [Helianthus annuus]KAJ0506180.1 hypothetical protein HanHA89_Chr12g0479031 [Helianthus annuus]KAJ0675852.1 hypothetical protein HanLR1_Chr12g0455941 [Helianthus annuus]KAJ0679104.1 hypothetical protein HanOQP8_Chr12g0455551 [Helianthus annuus]
MWSSTKMLATLRERKLERKWGTNLNFVSFLPLPFLGILDEDSDDMLYVPGVMTPTDVFVLYLLQAQSNPYCPAAASYIKVWPNELNTTSLKLLLPVMFKNKLGALFIKTGC